MRKSWKVWLLIGAVVVVCLLAGCATTPEVSKCLYQVQPYEQTAGNALRFLVVEVCE